jgi:hypothetical protein
MVKFGVIACMALLVAVADQAGAQPAAQALPGPPGPAATTAPLTLSGGLSTSIYSSGNVGQFVAVCERDQGGCADEVGGALIAKMTFDGTADICLPGPSYAGLVIDYLKAHPETHNASTEDGIYAAICKVYPCG